MAKCRPISSLTVELPTNCRMVNSKRRAQYPDAICYAPPSMLGTVARLRNRKIEAKEIAAEIDGLEEQVKYIQPSIPRRLARRTDSTSK
jgi:hypothetical protein